jgi:CRISPR-associated protein Csm1
MDNEEFKIIILSALLHDIGKFWQRTGKKESHSEIGVQFINEFQKQFPYPWLDDLRDGIGDHHQFFNKPIDQVKRVIKIVKLADRLSSGEREIDRTLSQLDPDKTPLIPILSRIEFKTPKPTERWATRLIKLSLTETFMPVPEEEVKVNSEIYKSLWEEFINEFKKLGMIDTISKINTLIFLLKKYTSCIPSATPWEEDEEYRTLPDISLYDHLKTTCAIARCLLPLPDSQIEGLLLGKQTEIEKPICQIIRADISGIQSFIYRITEPIEGKKKGTAKRLRGRSLYLSILLDVIAHWFIKELELTIANILFCGGGRFDILVPIDTDILKNFEEKINNYLLKEFYGELGIQIVSENVFLPDFGDLTQVYTNLEEKLICSKEKKFLNFISNPDFFVSQEKLYNVCDVCNLTPMTNRETCDYCKKHEKIGQMAPHTTTIAYLYGDCNFLKKEEDKIITLTFPDFKMSVIFIPNDEEGEIINKCINEGSTGIFYKLNTTDFILNTSYPQFSFGFKFLANEAPIAQDPIKIEEEIIEKDEVLSFDAIADMSWGTRLLGILKADVDYLGDIFLLGIEPKKTISRVSSLSSSLDFFFTGYLNKICQNIAEKWHNNPENKNQLKNKVKGLFYIVYSSGDDLLIIGPWDQIIELAKELNSQFKKYCGENKNLSLSAGILLVKPRFPIQRFSQLVSEELELSKSDADKPLSEQQKPYEKNRITLFGETVAWEDSSLGFDQLLSFGKDLERYVNEKKLPRTFLHFLERLYKQYFENKEEKPRPLWTPKFLYALTRRVKDENIFCELLSKIPIFKEKIRIPLWYAILKTRKEV